MLSLLKRREPTQQSVEVNVQQNFWTQLEEYVVQHSDQPLPISVVWMRLRMRVQSVVNHHCAAPKYQALTCGLSRAHTRSILVEQILLRLSWEKAWPLHLESINSLMKMIHAIITFTLQIESIQMIWTHITGDTCKSISSPWQLCKVTLGKPRVGTQVWKKRQYRSTTIISQCLTPMTSI